MARNGIQAQSSPVNLTLICLFQIALVSGSLFDFIHPSGHRGMSSEYKQINDWLKHNAPDDSDPESDLELANAYLEAHRSQLHGRLLSEWEQFVELYHLTPQLHCTADSTQLLERNFNSAGFEATPSGSLKESQTRIGKVIEDVAYQHAQNCASTYGYLAAQKLQSMGELELELLLQLALAFDSVFETHAAKVYSPKSRQAAALAHAIRDGNKVKSAEALHMAYKRMNRNSLPGAMRLSHTEISPSSLNVRGMEQSMKELADKCSHYLSLADEIFASANFDAATAFGQFEFGGTNLKNGWLRHLFCRNFLERNPAHLVEGFAKYSHKLFSR